ncbi:CAP domain-containing protein [Candidatus Roseilinea sp. NK_OTU-006]|jgi:uncharacterized protein YkwD|uniref:CAP domain-containing protein n=1 Tax=Candidatus Roseilinea sp. NK_OTU-006 TaxID=2704250 RepID=UPI001981BED8|nr:CAP domain-containing protein [Candidatus Roseilinea sp. NK_OTU-006]
MTQWVRYGAKNVIGAVWLVLLSLTSHALDVDVVIGEPVSIQYDASTAARPLFSGCSPITVPPANADFEQQVVEQVNDHRASIGRPRLKRVASLDLAARYHAHDMRDDDYFAHTSYDRVNGQLVVACSTRQRIEGFYPNWNWIGENIAAGYFTPSEVMEGWLDSPGHRSNIEFAEFWEIGVGYAAGGSYYHYWVQNFGRRQDVYPLVIQREYSRTATPTVSVFIYGNWQQMRLRNDDGPWGTWQPFSNSFTWTLNWIQGVRQVCAELQSGSQTTTSCDTIELTTGGPVLSAQPAQVNFVYVLATGQRFPQSAPLLVTNAGSNQALNWQVGTSPPWLTVTPSSGSTPYPNVQLSLQMSQVPSAPGSYTGTLKLNATNASTTATVNVRLRVVNSLPHHRFMPAVRR